MTFGGGGRNYLRAAKRLQRQAKAFSSFDCVSAFGPKDLDAGYDCLFRGFPQRFPKGYGFWSWKAYLIHREFQKLPENDLLVYLDCGCELNKAAEARLKVYLSFARNNDAFFFQLGMKNGDWSKPDPRLVPSEEIAGARILQSGVIALRKCDRVAEFLEDWLSLCSVDDGILLRDGSEDETAQYYHMHRHDQSCMNVAARKHGFIGFPDESWCPTHPLSKYVDWAQTRPVLAIRNRDGVSYQPLIRLVSLWFRIRRIFRKQ